MSDVDATKRYPELDALRGLAVLLMVLYHLVFDLRRFYLWDIHIYTGMWWLLAQSARIIFLVLVGMCFTISWERHHGMHFMQSCTKYFKRGLLIFTGGMLVSIVTPLIATGESVKFGVLHLIGVSTLLLPFFTAIGLLLKLLITLFLLAVAYYFNLPTIVHSPLLFPLGFVTREFASLDYFPLLPWFPVILLGTILGDFLYIPKRRTFLKLADALPYPPLLLWAGRRSLWIYFVHQPVLLLLLHFLQS